METYQTQNGYVIWEDFLYAPSQGQHECVMEAIEAGEKVVSIPHLSLRSVRPTIDMTSGQIARIL